MIENESLLLFFCSENLYIKLGAKRAMFNLKSSESAKV